MGSVGLSPGTSHHCWLWPGPLCQSLHGSGCKYIQKSHETSLLGTAGWPLPCSQSTGPLGWTAGLTGRDCREPPPPTSWQGRPVPGSLACPRGWPSAQLCDPGVVTSLNWSSWEGIFLQGQEASMPTVPCPAPRTQPGHPTDHHLPLLHQQAPPQTAPAWGSPSPPSAYFTCHPSHHVSLSPFSCVTASQRRRSQTTRPRI